MAYLAYIDESGDEQYRVNRSTSKFVMVSLLIPDYLWRETFEETKKFRRHLKKEYGLLIKKEIHSTDFLRGRGKIGTHTISKKLRSFIFKRIIQFISELPGISIICVSLENKDRKDVYLDSLERLLNRIDRFSKDEDTQVILIIDEGKENKITKKYRKMCVYNPIPSKYGSWAGGSSLKNIPITRIIEDPFFKQSEISYFLQLADVIAYSLLRYDEPTDRAKKYGIDKLFPLLKPVLNLKASNKDKLGVVRK